MFHRAGASACFHCWSDHVRAGLGGNERDLNWKIYRMKLQFERCKNFENRIKNGADTRVGTFAVNFGRHDGFLIGWNFETSHFRRLWVDFRGFSTLRSEFRGPSVDCAEFGHFKQLGRQFLNSRSCKQVLNYLRPYWAKLSSYNTCWILLTYINRVITPGRVFEIVIDGNNRKVRC